MKNIKFLILASLTIIFLLNSCSKEDMNDQINYESRIFENYLIANNITTEPTESGLYYIEEVEGTGLTPAVDDWVIINYSMQTIEDDKIIMSTDQAYAQSVGLYDERVVYGPNKMIVGYNILGIDEGLSLMKEGGKATLLFKSNLGYGSTSVGSVSSYSSLKIEIELLDVFSDPIAEEYQNMIAYLEEYEYSTDTTESGIYYVPIIEGDGATVNDDARVLMNVEASLLDGRVLYKASSTVFIVGSYDDNATYGLSEGIKLMNVGGSARLIVPFNYAFGMYGLSYHDGAYKVPIPPYSTIVYDVELLEGK